MEEALQLARAQFGLNIAGLLFDAIEATPVV